jgi:hypothetical protein
MIMLIMTIIRMQENKLISIMMIIKIILTCYYKTMIIIRVDRYYDKFTKIIIEKKIMIINDDDNFNRILLKQRLKI